MHKFTDTKEEQRLKALRDYNIIETNVDFDYILESLAIICDVPLCTIVAVYKDDLIVVDSAGIEIKKQHKRQGSCTQYTLKKNSFCEVEDIKEVEEILDKTYLLENFDIRFYAGCPLVDPHGNILGALNVYDDKPRLLTDQQRYFIKKAAERIVMLFLQKRQEQQLLHFDNMFNKSKDLIGVSTIDGEILKINPTFSEITGLSEDEILKKNLKEFFHPSSYPTGKDIQERFLESESNLTYVFRVIAAENQLRSIEWTGRIEKSTELVYFIGRDITEREEQSALLKNSEAKFRTFFENTQNLMFIHDMQLNIISANNTAAHVVEVLPEKLAGLNLGDFLPVNRKDFLTEYIRKIHEERVANGTAHVNVRGGKEKIWLYNSIVQENEKEEPYVLVNAVDLTNRYEMEEKL
ncbi:MAG TPA: PAS domain S-box protein, partial [Dysgonamonadaceae bacterium]|nr:PAS domain S-box protein [Dysgonamonadaceae bacterium]